MRLHKTLGVDSAVECQRLALVRFSYFGFDNQIHDDGEVVVLDAAADHVKTIFELLLNKRFPIEKAKLMNNYEGNDDASMTDNNTSAFNDRPISGGNSISIHAYGLAIDINPVQNPFCQRQLGVLHVSPEEGKNYLNREDHRPGMVESIVDIFADNGFPIWGGEWKNPIDYQHFQVSRSLAMKLTHSPAADAKSIFESQIKQYRLCRRAGKSRKLCIDNKS